MDLSFILKDHNSTHLENVVPWGKVVLVYVDHTYERYSFPP